MKLSFKPWIYFGLFFISNSLISYFPIGLSAKLWIFTFGVLVPFGIGLWSVLEVAEKDPTPTIRWFPRFIDNKNDQGIQWFYWVLFLGLIAFTRFYQLTSIPFWLISDEGIYATMSMALMKKWNWSILLTEGRMEPLLIWLGGLFFHVTGPSLVSLRLFTTFVSIATVLSAYFCLRPFLPRVTAFVYSWLFAFSFWALSFMRFFTHQELILLFEMWTIGCLGRLLTAQGTRSKWFWLTALILCNVLGFYSYVNWAVVWILIALLFLFLSPKIPQVKSHLLYLTLFTAFFIWPIVLDRFAPGGLSYMKSLFQLKDFPISFAGYLSNLFYDSRTSYPYSPDWGGMFDPVTGSFILLGCLYAVKTLDRKLSFALGLALFLCLLPGVVTNYIELHRVTTSFPFWILLAAFGVQSLIEEHGLIKALLPITLLGLLTLGLNFYDFIGPYGDVLRAPSLRQWRGVEYAEAYQILKTQSDASGPIYVFSEFNADYDNKTLDIATYPFNPLQNPALAATGSKWACLIIDIHYAPYIKKRYPGALITLLRTEKTTPNDRPPSGLYLIPLAQIAPDTLKNWAAMDVCYRNLNVAIKNRRSTQTWSQFYPACIDEKLAMTDPLMTAIYWEQKGMYAFFDGDYPSAVKAYQNAIAHGVPAAQLYYGLGVALQRMNRTREAEKAFRNMPALQKETAPYTHALN